MDKIRKRFVFHGEVQGVNFRWNAMQKAGELSVTGWARNLSDGAVEMEAEGTPESIAGLVESLKDPRLAYIEKIEEEIIPIREDDRFSIK